MAIFDLPLSELEQRTSMKWRRFDADVLPAWVAEMDCRPAPAVTEAVEHAIRIGDTGYPEGNAYPVAFAAFAADRWDWKFTPEDAVNVPDVMQGIVAALHALTEPNAHVVINNPVYNSFYAYLPWANRQILEVPLGADNHLDLAAMEAAFAGEYGVKPQAYLLCNPHNPTGTQFTGEELAKVAELAEQHNVVVVSDEIHAPLLPIDADFVPYLSLPGTDTAVTITSASKSWNLAGIKAAVAIGGSASADALRSFPREVTSNASHLGILSHVAALDHGRAWLDDVVAEIGDHRRLLADLLAARLPELDYHQAPATYLAWVDCSALGWADPAARFRTKGKVALSPGSVYGTGSGQFVRINLATSPAILTEVVDRMTSAAG